MSTRDIEKEIFVLKLKMIHVIDPKSTEYIDAIRALVILQDMLIASLKNQVKEFKHAA